ncbi:hypothetical protein [Agromyces archimandritae]|uniref:Uncharacterized protein n=1 Tax=Agromyces archimandritae TaxID=2781962 RepID=A0A975FLQ1_9MICO|nr:hypothetical protein [Agromyces archimandritae]QTX04785.1 hypothetical protein G127AT_00460 [Agromyces archimandritae]
MWNSGSPTSPGTPTGCLSTRPARARPSPTEAEAAVRINTDTRLGALKIWLLILAGVSAIAILPATRLPAYRPEEIPDPSPEDAA